MALNPRAFGPLPESQLAAAKRFAYPGTGPTLPRLAGRSFGERQAATPAPTGVPVASEGTPLVPPENPPSETQGADLSQLPGFQEATEPGGVAAAGGEDQAGLARLLEQAAQPNATQQDMATALRSAQTLLKGLGTGRQVAQATTAPTLPNLQGFTGTWPVAGAPSPGAIGMPMADVTNQGVAVPEVTAPLGAPSMPTQAGDALGGGEAAAAGGGISGLSAGTAGAGALAALLGLIASRTGNQELGMASQGLGVGSLLTKLGADTATVLSGGLGAGGGTAAGGAAAGGTAAGGAAAGGTAAAAGAAPAASLGTGLSGLTSGLAPVVLPALAAYLGISISNAVSDKNRADRAQFETTQFGRNVQPQVDDLLALGNSLGALDTGSPESAQAYLDQLRQFGANQNTLSQKNLQLQNLMYEGPRGHVKSGPSTYSALAPARAASALGEVRAADILARSGQASPLSPADVANLLGTMAYNSSEAGSGGPFSTRYSPGLERFRDITPARHAEVLNSTGGTYVTEDSPATDVWKPDVAELLSAYLHPGTYEQDFSALIGGPENFFGGYFGGREGGYVGQPGYVESFAESPWGQMGLGTGMTAQAGQQQEWQQMLEALTAQAGAAPAEPAAPVSPALSRLTQLARRSSTGTPLVPGAFTDTLNPATLNQLLAQSPQLARLLQGVTLQ